MKKVTLHTLAQMFGVSTVTVHKALTNQKGVSAELRQKIADAAATQGYIPPKTTKLSLSFAFVIEKEYLLRPNEQLYSEIYYHLNAECLLQKAKLHLLVFDDLSAFHTSFKSVVGSERLDGVFIAGAKDPMLLDYIRTLKLPTICIDFYHADYPFDYIYTDNYYAGYQITEYLIHKGHKQIGFIGDIGVSDIIADRYFGFRKALNRHHLPFHEEFHLNRRIEDGDFKLPSVLPTAFICHCDRAASFLYAKLQHNGLSVPEDISVAGIDNTDLCEHLQPKLTSFGIEKKKYASHALQTMLMHVRERALTLNYAKFNLDLYERASVLDLNLGLSKNNNG